MSMTPTASFLVAALLLLPGFADAAGKTAKKEPPPAKAEKKDAPAADEKQDEAADAKQEESASGQAKKDEAKKSDAKKGDAKGVAPAGGRPSGQLALAAGALGPLPEGEKVGWEHAPFEEGDCSICHERKDPKNPGKITMPVNTLCYSCHDEFESLMAKREHKHAAAVAACTNCHNPHNAKAKKLLLGGSARALCLSCHPKMRKEIEGAKVLHAAVDADAACANCHNPHASNVEKLLVQLPYDLCMRCHSSDNVVDPDGRKLMNLKKWLDANKDWHAPVADKDCSACHLAHGSANFRLLKAAYPAQFYAPYDPANYALCFECHNDQILADPETTTLTGFRDGKINLHYLHVNKAERGRTCRACHEVHAGNQPHHIRDAVPYGSKGWMLKVNYTRTATGGSCARTCHSTRDYRNKSAAK